MKHLFYILLLSILFVSCNSTKPAIITSKKEAIKKNKYDATINKSVVKKVRKQKPTTIEDNPDFSTVKVDKKEIEDREAFTGKRSLIDAIIAETKENLGVPYRMGGLTKAGIDCSGLLYTSFQKFDISLPRTSRDMAQTGYKVDKEEAQKGDLIFFITNGKSISHVGLITEVKDNGEIKFIHSSTSRGVMISSLNETYFRQRFATIKRVLD